MSKTTRSLCMAGRSLAAAAVLVLAGGCQSPPSLREAYAAYDAGRYRDAYRIAAPIADHASGAQRDEAAYMAGLAAQRVGDMASARRYLIVAGRSADPKLAGDALGALGLAYSEQGLHDRAARAFLASARHKQGEDRAQAHFYAATAYEKMGRRSEAWTYFTLAEGQSKDAAFRRRVAQEKSSTGWTIQTGAFTVEDRAQLELFRLNLLPREPWGPARVVKAVTARGEPLHLVQLGYFSSYATAERARAQLGLTAARCVPIGPAR